MTRFAFPALFAATLLLFPTFALADDEEEVEEAQEPAESDLPEEVEGAKDHPAIKRYPGSIIIGHYIEREFEAFLFPTSAEKWEKVEGKFYRAHYWFPRKTSCTQVLRNYENAFKAKGMTITSGRRWTSEVEEQLAEELSLAVVSGERWVTGILEGKKGGQTYVLQTCGEYNHNTDVQGMLVVVETQAMDQKMEITADFLAEEIEKSGRVALYGIQFATGKADITPDSAKTLAEIAGLLASKATWKLRIEGHTDNVGSAKSNLELSKKRAQAVKSWLVSKHKVAPARLSTDGFGDTRPIGDNATEEGRAQNRRVELVKL